MKEYKLLEEISIDDKSKVGFIVNIDYKGYPLLYDLYSQYRVIDMNHDNKGQLITNSLLSVPHESFSISIDQYNQGMGFGFNDAWIGQKDGQVYFGVIDDYIRIPIEVGNKIIEKFFINYYWYMESLDKKEHPAWYKEFADTLKKYYPKEADEIDGKIKSGNKIEIPKQ